MAKRRVVIAWSLEEVILLQAGLRGRVLLPFNIDLNREAGRISHRRPRRDASSGHPPDARRTTNPFLNHAHAVEDVLGGGRRASRELQASGSFFRFLREPARGRRRAAARPDEGSAAAEGWGGAGARQRT